MFTRQTFVSFCERPDPALDVGSKEARGNGPYPPGTQSLTGATA